jgi:HTH-type transcriptional regulator/antitoxin HigA
MNATREEEAMATAVLDFTIPHVLRNVREYRAAVREIDALLDAEVRRGTPGWDRLRFLSVLIEAYEEEIDPIAQYLAGCTPQSAVDYMLDQREMTRAELAPILGGSSRVSEFFTGKRSLSIGQIRKLRDAFGIPADLLVSRV